MRCRKENYLEVIFNHFLLPSAFAGSMLLNIEGKYLFSKATCFQQKQIEKLVFFFDKVKLINCFRQKNN